MSKPISPALRDISRRRRIRHIMPASKSAARIICAQAAIDHPDMIRHIPQGMRSRPRKWTDK